MESFVDYFGSIGSTVDWPMQIVNISRCSLVVSSVMQWGYSFEAQSIQIKRYCFLKPRKLFLYQSGNLDCLKVASYSTIVSHNSVSNPDRPSSCHVCHHDVCEEPVSDYRDLTRLIQSSQGVLG